MRLSGTKFVLWGSGFCVLIELLCLSGARAIANQQLQTNDQQFSRLISDLRSHESAAMDALKFSETRFRFYHESKNPDQDEPRKSLSAYIMRRQPELVRSLRAEFREPSETDPIEWEVDDPNWHLISSIDDLRFSPTEAIGYLQRKNDPNDPHPDSTEQAEVRLFTSIAASGPRRYQHVVLGPYDVLCGFVPGPNCPLSEFLTDKSVTTSWGDRAILDGVECTTLTAKKIKSGTYKFWFDASNRIRRIEIRREAFDEYLGKPIWKSYLFGKYEKQTEPDEGQLKMYLSEVHRFSDYREIAPGAIVPYRCENEFERRDGEGEMHTSLGKCTLEGLTIRKDEFPEEDMKLDIPNGTSAYATPRDGVPLEWIDGKVVKSFDTPAQPTEPPDQPGVAELAVTKAAGIDHRYWYAAGAVVLLLGVVTVATASRRRDRRA